MARVMVLCAGYGTRLKPLSDARPKPLVPIGDRPLLAHIAQHLARQGVDEVVINTHHQAEHFPSFVRSLPLTVQVSEEADILGTAGGVAAARTKLEPPVLVWNGDILARPDVRDLLATAPSTALRLVVAPTSGAGSVGLDARGRVCRLRGEVFGNEVCSADYVGIAQLGVEALSALPERGCLIGDLCLPILRRGGSIESAQYSGYWSDSGTLNEYLKTNLTWLDQLGVDSWLGRNAEVSASVERSVVGEGATVEAPIHACVVWPHARVTEPASRAVITDSGRVVPIDG